MAHDVFISHSSKDKPIADSVCATLEQAGVRCWIAPRDIPAGADWPAEIVKAIADCSVLVLIFSAHSNASQQVAREIGQAASEEKTILPFRTAAVDAEGSLKYYLRNTHWLDALDPPLERRLQELLTRVQMCIGRPGEPTPRGHVTAAEPVRRMRKQRTKRVVIAAASIVVAAATVGGLTWRSYHRSDQTVATTQSSNPAVASPAEQRGWAAMKRGDYVAAASEFDAAIAQHPTPEASLGRGIARVESGNEDLALADLDEAIRQQPANAQALAYRALAEGMTGDTDGSLRDATAALRLDPKQPLAYAQRSVLFAVRCDFQTAMRDAEAAIAIDPNNGWGWVARSAAEQDPEKSLQNLDEAVRLSPTCPWVFAARAFKLMDDSRYDEAAADANEALRLQPRCAYALAARGMINMNRAALEVRPASADVTRDSATTTATTGTTTTTSPAATTNPGNDRILADCDEAVRLRPKFYITYDVRSLAYAQRGQVDEALADAEHAVSLAPAVPEPYQFRAMALASAGKWDAALADAKHAVGLNSRSWVSYYVLGLIHVRREDWQTAREALVTASERNPRALAVWVMLATVDASLGKYDRVVADLTNGLERSPSNVTALVGRARAYEELKDAAKAEADFKAAVTAAPDNPVAHVAYGNFLAGLADHSPERFTDAKHEYDEALRLAPGVATTLCDRGDLLRKHKDYQQAVDDYTAAIAADPKMDWAWFQRAFVRHQAGQDADALLDALQAAKLKPTYGVYPLMCGQIRVALGQTEQALKDFDDAIRIMPSSYTPYWEKASVYLRAGEREKAAEAVASCLNVSPPNSETVGLRLLLLQNCGRPDQAMTEITALASKYPLDPNLQALRAEMAMRTNHPEVAVTACDQVLRLVSSDLNALMIRARAEGLLGKFDAALADLDKAIAMKDGDTGESRHLRAQARLAAGDVDGAIGDLTEAIKLDKTPADHYRARGLIYDLSGKPDLAAADRAAAAKLIPAYAGQYRLVVSEVMDYGQGKKLGLQKGDVIVSYDGRPLTGPDLPELAVYPGKSTRTVAIERDGQRLTLEAAPGPLGIHVDFAEPTTKPTTRP